MVETAQDSTPESDWEEWTCTDCGKKLDTLEELYRHLLRHRD